MPFLVEIDGYQLDMGDGFGQLAPQDQQKALEEAGEYIKARGSRQAALRARQRLSGLRIPPLVLPFRAAWTRP